MPEVFGTERDEMSEYATEAATDAACEVTGRPAGPIWEMMVRGEVDIAAAPIIRSQFERAAARSCTRVVADLSAVTFVDCGGLAQLEQVAADNGLELWFRAPSPAVCWIASLAPSGIGGWRGHVPADQHEMRIR